MPRPSGAEKENLFSALSAGQVGGGDIASGCPGGQGGRSEGGGPGAYAGEMMSDPIIFEVPGEPQGKRRAKTEARNENHGF